jgi:DNA-binding Xre family transcriptional regulator
MKQLNRNVTEMTKNQIQRSVTTNFLKVVEELVAIRYAEITNEKELADYIEISQSLISKLKSDENRYVSLDMLARLVNILGANANSVFVLDKSSKEKLIRDGFVVNAGRSGNTNNISNSKINNFLQGPVMNGDNHKGDINTTLKIINTLPAKDRKEVKQYFDSLTNQNTGLENKVEGLKKILDQHEKTIKKKDGLLEEKNKKLFELQQELLDFYKKEKKK